MTDVVAPGTGKQSEGALDLVAPSRWPTEADAGVPIPCRPVRVLCSCLPGYGHFNPLVPLARALAGAGHSVAFATAAEFCPRVREAGFDVYPAGPGMAAQIDQARRRYPVQHAMSPGKARFETFVPRMLAGVAAPARLEDLIPLVQRWQPQVIVHDEAELAAPVAGAMRDIPWASQSIVLRRPPAMARLAGHTVRPLAEHYGVDIGEMAGLFRYLHLDSCPPMLQPADSPTVSVAHLVRNTDDLDTATGDHLPSWVAQLPARPTIYVTLGTLFNRNRAVLAALLGALGDKAYNVIATVGTDNIAALGPQPPNIRLADYIPLSLLLPHLDVVVTQGGTSILPALGAGLPLLVVPQGADQFHNAEACLSAGVGLRLLPDEVHPDAVAAHVRRLLDEPSFAHAARQAARQLVTMAGPDHGVALLERLEAERRPLTGMEPR